MSDDSKSEKAIAIHGASVLLADVVLPTGEDWGVPPEDQVKNIPPQVVQHLVKVITEPGSTNEREKLGKPLVNFLAVSGGLEDLTKLVRSKETPAEVAAYACKAIGYIMVRLVLSHQPIPKTAHESIYLFVTQEYGYALGRRVFHERVRYQCHERTILREEIGKAFAEFYSKAALWDQLFNLTETNNTQEDVRGEVMSGILRTMGVFEKLDSTDEIPPAVFDRFIGLLTKPDATTKSVAEPSGRPFLEFCYRNGLTERLLQVAQGNASVTLKTKANELLAKSLDPNADADSQAAKAPARTDTNPDPYHRVQRNMGTAIEAKAVRAQPPPLPEAAKRKLNPPPIPARIGSGKPPSSGNRG